METCNTKTCPCNAMWTIAIIGAILAIISIFLNWAEIKEVAKNGLYLIQNMGDVSNYWGAVAYMPLITLIFAIIAIINGIISNFKKDLTKICGILSIICGLIVVISTIYFMFGSVEGTNLMTDNHIGIGVYLALLGGIVILISGIMPTISKDN